MKYTLFLTQRCNLACSYCYVGKTSARMAMKVAEQAIRFAFQKTPPSENIDIGFFGGEPLLEFPLLAEITEQIESDEQYNPERVKLGTVTNGTLLTEEMLRFFQLHHIALTISCDGPPEIQDISRRFIDGTASSALVERAIRMAVSILGRVPVNAVYRPETVANLPQTVDYFSSLGVRQIYLNPDFSARWTEADIENMIAAYLQLAEQYMQYYREGRPHFISIFDSKITVMLRGGYQPLEKCRMGEGEFAFTPAGRVYPCERLAASDPELHAVGAVNGLVQIGPLRNHFAPGTPLNTPCLTCGIRDYCVNWCGCSNYFMTGHYNRVSPFLCASERTLIAGAFNIFQTLEAELGPTFVEHLGGQGLVPSVAGPASAGPGRKDVSHEAVVLQTSQSN